VEPTKATTTKMAGPILSARRALICLAVGLAAGALVAVLWSPELTPLVGWSVAAVTALVWVWRLCWSQDPLGTERLAEAESRSRSTDAWVLTAAVASLAAVAVALVRSSGRQDAVAVASVLLSVVAVALSWMLLNTVFALKYARLYYLDEPNGRGIDFKQEQQPSYADFAYMAFTVGAQYGVTETEPTRTLIRKVALGHALLSYVFGTVILAVAINLVTNLGQ
jgi:uncharacterized membrane protein